MQTDKNTIIITGGSSGIGLAMAKAFSEAGNQVIICGRRKGKLQEAKQLYPSLHIRVCDIENKSSRYDLFRWVTAEFPHVNMLVNNAGIQKRLIFWQVPLHSWKTKAK